MYPFPTYVLDHAFGLAADRLFEIVEEFVKPLSVKEIKALGPGDWHIDSIRAGWDEKPERIVIDGVMFTPFNQESRPSEQGTQRYSKLSDEEMLSRFCDHPPSRSIQLVELEITVVNDQRLTARIGVTPGTDGEPFGIGLAGYVVRATGGDAAYQEWLEWVRPRIEPAGTDGEASSEAPEREAGRELGTQGGTMERVKETFHVDTYPDNFLHALQRLTQELRQPLFSEKAVVHLQQARIAGQYKGLPSGTFVIEIPSVWTYPDGEQNEVREMMRFEVTKVASERIRVTAESWSSAKECFRELLAKLEELYPEIREGQIARAREKAEAIIKKVRAATGEVATEGNAVLQQGQPGTPEDEAPKPWERIPDNGYDRKIVELLWTDYTDPRIASAEGVGRAAKTITNRLSVLRKLYPDEVPTRQQLREMSVKGKRPF